MTDLHTQLVAEVQRRLDVAHNACCGTGGTWHLRAADGYGDTSRIDDENDEAVVYDEGAPAPYEAEHIVLHDPADAIRRYEADLRRLERHRPRDLPPMGWLCAGCSITEGDGVLMFVDWFGCPEIWDLAASLGVEVPA